jgi:hypothetical protein
MIAHLSTMQRMTAEQAASLTRLINLWLQVFDTRVDPAEATAASCGRDRFPCHRPVSGSGAQLGKRDGPHDRICREPRAELCAGVTEGFLVSAETESGRHSIPCTDPRT